MKLYTKNNIGTKKVVTALLRRAKKESITEYMLLWAIEGWLGVFQIHEES